MERCPCLSGLVYDECCGRFHAGTSIAPTAERLVRSRYSAYALGLPDYIVATWHHSTRPADLVLDDGVRWFRLDILSRTRGGMLDTRATVEFEAHYLSGSGTGSQHEVSRFVREGGKWFYVDAV
jgi:SEC-C motif-containing protein